MKITSKHLCACNDISYLILLLRQTYRDRMLKCALPKKPFSPNLMFGHLFRFSKVGLAEKFSARSRAYI